VRFTFVRSPAATVIVGVLRQGRVDESERRQKKNEVDFSVHKFMLTPCRADVDREVIT
jgi:hypothetical protein